MEYYVYDICKTFSNLKTLSKSSCDPQLVHDRARFEFR